MITKLKELTSDTQHGVKYSFDMNNISYVYSHEAYRNDNVKDGEEGSYDDVTEILRSEDNNIVWSFESYVPLEEAIMEYAKELNIIIRDFDREL